MADFLTNDGKNFITLTLTASTGKWVHWGQGTTAAAATASIIETPGAEARVSGAQTQQTTTTTNDTYQVTGTIVSASGQTIANAGVLSASTSGTLILYSSFTGVPLLANDSIAFTFKLKQA